MVYSGKKSSVRVNRNLFAKQWLKNGKRSVPHCSWMLSLVYTYTPNYLRLAKAGVSTMRIRGWF